MSRLLINDFVIPISIILAEKVGLHGAIFLQQLHYWLQDSKNIHDGYKWVFNTYQDWHEQMPFFTVNQIRRIVRELEKRNLIVTGNFNSIKMDKTKWYRINYEAVKELCEDMNNIKLSFEHCNNENCPHTEENSDQSNEETDKSNGQSPETSSIVQETQSDDYTESPRHEREHRAIPKTTTETTPEKMINDDEYVRELNPSFQFFEENGFGNSRKLFSGKNPCLVPRFIYRTCGW